MPQVEQEGCMCMREMGGGGGGGGEEKVKRGGGSCQQTCQDQSTGRARGCVYDGGRNTGLVTVKPAKISPQVGREKCMCMGGKERKEGGGWGGLPAKPKMSCSVRTRVCVKESGEREYGKERRRRRTRTETDGECGWVGWNWRVVGKAASPQVR